MLVRTGALLLAMAVAGCASAPPSEGQLIADPYENVNRNFHAFNKGVDRAVINPASKVYDVVTPQLGKFLIGNALSHLSLPGLFANHLLQGDLTDAGATLARFTLNTVMGGGGFLDPATEFGATYRETDFGLTLADWGVPPGVYVELPVFGPSSTRDAVGKVVDLAFKPTTYFGGGDAQVASYAIRGVDILDTRDRYRAVINDVLYRSEDSYISSRSTYIQNRRRLEAGETQVEALPDIFE